MKRFAVVFLLATWIVFAQSPIATCVPRTSGPLAVTICQIHPSLPAPTKTEMESDFYRVLVVTTNQTTAEIRVQLTVSLPLPHTVAQSLDYNRVQNNCSLQFRVPTGAVISSPVVTELPPAVEFK